MRNRRGFFPPLFLIQMNMQKNVRKVPKVTQQSAFKQKKNWEENAVIMCSSYCGNLWPLQVVFFVQLLSKRKKETPTTTIYPKARLLPCCGFTVASERAPPFPTFE